MRGNLGGDGCGCDAAADTSSTPKQNAFVRFLTSIAPCTEEDK